MSFLIAIVLPFAYMVIALWITVPAWKRAVTAGGSYRTAGVLTLVMGLPFILLGINRTLVWQADREVDRLCALDGGVHVYETVTLGPENFGPDGTVFPQYQLEAARNPGRGLRYGPDYAVVSKDSVVRSGTSILVPGIRRFATQYVRQADGKLLAERVRYSRGGGDLPGPWTGTSHSCSSSLYPTSTDRVIFINSGSQQ